jgi:hypothetical protein
MAISCIIPVIVVIATCNCGVAAASRKNTSGSLGSIVGTEIH